MSWPFGHCPFCWPKPDKQPRYGFFQPRGGDPIWQDGTTPGLDLCGQHDSTKYQRLLVWALCLGPELAPRHIDTIRLVRLVHGGHFDRSQVLALDETAVLADASACRMPGHRVPVMAPGGRRRAQDRRKSRRFQATDEQLASLQRRCEAGLGVSDLGIVLSWSDWHFLADHAADELLDELPQNARSRKYLLALKTAMKPRG